MFGWTNVAAELPSVAVDMTSGSRDRFTTVTGAKLGAMRNYNEEMRNNETHYKKVAP